jgi:hypothetical protein
MSLETTTLSEALPDFVSFLVPNQTVKFYNNYCIPGQSRGYFGFGPVHHRLRRCCWKLFGFQWLQTTILKGLFSYLVYTFGRSRSRHPSKMVRVGSFPRRGGPKTTQIKHLFIFIIVWLKKILAPTFILFYMCRIIFALHLNPYFVTVGHCPGGLGPL